MEYLPTFTIKNQLNVGKYTIHGSYGIYIVSFSSLSHIVCVLLILTCIDIVLTRLDATFPFSTVFCLHTK